MHPDDYLVLEDESGRVKLGVTMLSPSVSFSPCFSKKKKKKTVGIADKLL